MMATTKIEWCDRTWSPITGCTKISPGCQNCYAERMAKRLAGRCGYLKDNPFNVTKHDDKLFIQPLKWRKPSKIFICSMGDLFHQDVKESWIDGIFAIMGLTYDHTGEMFKHEDGGESAILKQRHNYFILTKRPERLREYIQKLVDSDCEELRKRFYHFSKTACILHEQSEYLWQANASIVVTAWIKDGMPGLWLGVTAENQEQADKRIPILLETPASKRFVSVEPMLEAVNLKNYLGTVHEDECGSRNIDQSISESGGLPFHDSWVKGIDWVICGSESGPGARPMDIDWARDLRDQCQAAKVPFFFKQLIVGGKKITMPELDGKVWGEWPEER